MVSNHLFVGGLSGGTSSLQARTRMVMTCSGMTQSALCTVYTVHEHGLLSKGQRGGGMEIQTQDFNLMIRGQVGTP